MGKSLGSLIVRRFVVLRKLWGVLYGASNFGTSRTRKLKSSFVKECVLSLSLSICMMLKNTTIALVL